LFTRRIDALGKKAVKKQKYSGGLLGV